MANILDRYGIKEVADVTFYKINNDGTIGDPVIYLDTLKVSTIEETASQTSARGGKGNPELIMWDYGREITITLEDALFSAKSMALMFNQSGTTKTDAVNIQRAVQIAALSTNASKVTINNRTFNVTSATMYDQTGASTTNYSNASWADVTFAAKDPTTIEISAEQFPGTYYIVGDTYARSETTGVDEFFQFIVPKAKVMAGQTITMQAEGDPSTFSMNVKVLRPADGVMLKLVKYDITQVAQG